MYSAKNHIKEYMKLLNKPVSPCFLSICWQLVDLEGFCFVVILQEAETKQNSIKFNSLQQYTLCTAINLHVQCT